MMAREAFASLAVVQADDEPVPSRVETGLEAHARSAEWQASSYVIEVRAVTAPQISAAALAREMDGAEKLSMIPLQRSITLRAKRHPIVKARVAGWVKRVKPAPKTRIARQEIRETKEIHDETPAQIIERSLRADL